MPSLLSYYERPDIDGRLVQHYLLARDWQHSPRDATGKLRLVSLPFSESLRILQVYSNRGGTVPTGVVGPRYSDTYPCQLAAANAAYSKLRAKLYKGGATLGVTLATYRQSREMVVNRYRSLDARVEELYARAFSRKKAGRDVSNLVLETIFGWKPLLQDIWQACNTVIQWAPEGGWVTGRAFSHWRVHEVEKVGDGYTTWASNGVISVTAGAQYRVDNPNLWLAERAGLTNPATIAWDLVPWSFVVNMFSNVGGLVQSITDYAGLSFENSCTSYNLRSFQYITTTSPGYFTDRSGGVFTDKSRGIGGIPRPELQLKLPDANWELAAIAASLFGQRFGKLQGLIAK